MLKQRPFLFKRSRSYFEFGDSNTFSRSWDRAHIALCCITPSLTLCVWELRRLIAVVVAVFPIFAWNRVSVVPLLRPPLLNFSFYNAAKCEFQRGHFSTLCLALFCWDKQQILWWRDFVATHTCISRFKKLCLLTVFLSSCSDFHRRVTERERESGGGGGGNNNNNNQTDTSQSIYIFPSKVFFLCPKHDI